MIEITTSGKKFVKGIKTWDEDRTIKVPCGKCGFCLQSKRTAWMFRIHWEMFHQMHPGWFLTFTYAEKYVKRVPNSGALSLRFKDIQLMIKKLRKAKFYVKYVCVGEYGSKTQRPHYHALLWTDCPVLQIESYWSTKRGARLGNVHTGRITMQSAMYTLKYILQPKQSIKGVEQVRAQFSKGLGLAYLSASVYNYHTMDHDSPNFSTMVNGEQVALPRYYSYKIFTKYQRQQERVRLSLLRWKEKRKLYAKLRAKGVKKIRWYLQALQVQRAQSIINKSKLNLTI